MAEAYNSTDRRSIDTKPNTPRLVHEDTIYLSGFSTFDSGKIVDTSIDITAYNQVKQVTDIRGPSTLNFEIMHVIRDGGEFTYFYKAPYYRRFADVSSPSTIQTAWANSSITNQVNIGDDTFFSYLRIQYFTTATTSADRSSSYYTQEFRYKIWSTVF